MATKDIFQALTPDAQRNVLRRAKNQTRARTDADYAVAIDYLENRQIADIEGELRLRYPATQAGGSGQDIEPIAIPLVDRYVAEAATAYTRPVTRKITLLDGQENDATKAMTAEMNRHLDAANYDEKLHRLDQILVYLGDAGLWFQVKAGKIRPVVALPHNIFPVTPEEDRFIDPTDQGDYQGFIVQIDTDISDMGLESEMAYAFVTPANIMLYSGQGPFEPNSATTKFHDNPFRWVQQIDTEDHKGTGALLPLQMFTIWHKRLPVDSLLPFPDPLIFHANREINVAWSVLMDTFKIQSWDTTVLNLMNTENAAASLPHGARMPWVLDIGETATKLSSTTPYATIVSSLQSFVRLLAVTHRMSPNEFAIEGAGPQSGFAKLVDSLPKIEAREERIKRLKSTEENVAWPRIASIGVYLGWEGFNETSVKNTKLDVQFSDIEFPRTIQERNMKEEHDLKHKLTTRAELLAKRNDIDIEAAKEQIAENMENEGNGTTEQQPGQQQGAGLSLRNIIGQRQTFRGNQAAKEDNRKGVPGDGNSR